MWKKIRKDEYVLDDKICRMTKEKQKKIRRLDYIHFNSGRVAL